MKFDLTVPVYQGVVRHFVGLSWWFDAPGYAKPSGSRFGCASCFVVEVRDVWFLVTAAHVVRDLDRLQEQGARVAQWRLEDQATGKFEKGIPFDFDRGNWIVIDGDDGADYAAYPLRDIYRMQLAAGGVAPLGQEAWGVGPSEKLEVLFMLGIPTETVRVGSPPVIKLVMIPMDLAEPPAGSERKPDREYAKLRSPGPEEPPGVQDIDGMSGGPVFGLTRSGEAMVYQVLGIQSHWFPVSRVVSFCPLSTLALAIVEAIDTLQSRRD